MICFIESVTVCIGTKNFAAVPFFGTVQPGNDYGIYSLDGAASRQCRIY